MPTDYLANDPSLNPGVQPQQRAPIDYFAGSFNAGAGDNSTPINPPTYPAPLPTTVGGWLGRIGSAAGTAGSDALSALYNSITNIPSDVSYIDQNLPGALEEVAKNPLQASSQLGAGITELGHQLINTPKNVADYLANRVNLIPQSWANAVPAQNDISGDINQFFGSATTPADQFLRSTGQNALNIAGTAAGISELAPYLTTKNAIKNQLLNTHDALQAQANQQYAAVSNAIKERNVPNLDPDRNAILDVLQYLPQTQTYQDMLSSAYDGDYDSLRSLQSDLYNRAKKGLASDDLNNNLIGENLMEKRQLINNSVANSLNNLGQSDLAQTLQDANNNYRTLKQIYYNPNLGAPMIKMFDSNIRKIPPNLINTLGTDSVPMQNLINYHPGLQDNINGYNRAQFILNKLKYPALGFLSGMGFEGGEHVINNFNNSNH